ncbi:MAG: biotin--[acetyl-CoA-carboxylase] ligase [Clostridiaceae bacterium]|nr:biotin--[acetyl-CoA-carboxylase] ligase [Clostridiaceae bacterium]
MKDKLISSLDLLTKQEVDKFLNTSYIGRNILHFDSIDSTNTKAKELAGLDVSHGTLVISEEQTSGRGRLGRQWSSPKFKGIWMSIILKPNLDPTKASNITLIGAAAVINALKDFGIKAQIKWPNDIILNKKKLGGILTEMSSKLNLTNYIVMGMGINVNVLLEDFSGEIKNIATSLRIETGEVVSRQKFMASILNHFEVLYEEYIKEDNFKGTLETCRKNSILLGKEIQLYIKGVLVTAKAVDIDGEGLLIIEHMDGKVEKIMSGEVSMHGL